MSSADLRQRTNYAAAAEAAADDIQDSADAALNLPTIFDPVSCTRKGLCPVTQIRHQEAPLESHSLYFEQHGSGPEKVIFIMGLNSSSFSWAPQVQHFGRDSRYTVLVFDNRGVGNSDTPRGPYSTSGMAEDVIVLLDYLGWTDERDIHVVGSSMGGMIAQELATRIPERIITLSLVVTTAGGMPWSNFAPLKGTVSLARLLFISDIEQKIPILLEMVFPPAWLDQDADDDPEGRTNREIQAESYRLRLRTTRPQKPLGALSQMWAGLGHRVTPDRLASISRSIPKVVILTGDEDNLVDPSNSQYLGKHMKEAELINWEGTGHGLQLQWSKRFNALLERVFEEGRQRVAKHQSA
ncbi:hypothetical protein EVG20_g5616 [Dentipellis fragilis]|uniref:AB hydrolase-1 domain-containing protein n=1 Tax=Dentipellis fragilis TaxID=205917 RepID=A0A4Y9YW71_9AGAM|nr:hypothetical protein EVG20_g5616 [Dentipellis fragilis]